MQKQGVSLLLVILILASLMGATFTISEIVLRGQKTTKGTEISEAAYYKAETAAELALYYLNKVHLDYQDVVQKINEELGLEAMGIKVDEVGLKETLEIEGENCQEVIEPPPYSLCFTLQPQQSLQVDLDINGASYPEEIRISSADGGLIGADEHKVILYLESKENPNDVSQIDCDPPTPETPYFKCPLTSVIDGYYFKIKATNLSTTPLTSYFQGWSMSGPVEPDPTVIGFYLQTSGKARDFTRQSEVNYKKWHLYGKAE